MNPHGVFSYVKREKMGYKGSVALTLQERQCIEKCIKEGWKTGTIAREIGRSLSCVKTEIRKNGGKSVYSAQQSHDRAVACYKARIASLHRGFSEQEVENMKKWFSEGKSINFIAISLKATQNSVGNWQKRHIPDYKKKHVNHFLDRIEALESQMEIILDLLRQKNA